MLNLRSQSSQGKQAPRVRTQKGRGIDKTELIRKQLDYGLFPAMEGVLRTKVDMAHANARPDDGVRWFGIMVSYLLSGLFLMNR